MSDHDKAAHRYFEVEPTALTIPSRGALAIYCGDAPRRHPNGTTSFSIRGPLLLMPPEMWTDAEATMAKIAKVLNDHAHLFFDSAPRPEPKVADDPSNAALARHLQGDSP